MIAPQISIWQIPHSMIKCGFSKKNQRSYGMTNLRVLRHAWSTALYARVSFCLPLRCFCRRQRSAPSQINSRRAADYRGKLGQGRQGEKPKRKSRSFDLLFFLALLVGLEPTTYGLTVRRSTDWAKGEYLLKRKVPAPSYLPGPSPDKYFRHDSV